MKVLHWFLKYSTIIIYIYIYYIQLINLLFKTLIH